MARVRTYIKRKAVHIEESIGDQLIADKLAQEFGGEGDMPSEVNTPDQTAEGPGNVAGATSREESRKKSILAQVWQLSNDEFDDACLREYLLAFVPATSLYSSTCSRQVRSSAAYFTPTPDASRRLYNSAVLSLFLVFA